MYSSSPALSPQTADTQTHCPFDISIRMPNEQLWYSAHIKLTSLLSLQTFSTCLHCDKQWLQSLWLLSLKPWNHSPCLFLSDSYSPAWKLCWLCFQNVSRGQQLLKLPTDLLLPAITSDLDDSGSLMTGSPAFSLTQSSLNPTATVTADTHTRSGHFTADALLFTVSYHAPWDLGPGTSWLLPLPLPYSAADPGLCSSLIDTSVTCPTRGCYSVIPLTGKQSLQTSAHPLISSKFLLKSHCAKRPTQTSQLFQKPITRHGALLTFSCFTFFLIFSLTYYLLRYDLSTY